MTEQKHATATQSRRGFSAIGLVRPKDKANVGSVLRAAWCYSAAMVAIEGDRSPVRHAADTPRAWRHLPVLRPGSLRDVIPFDAIPVAVDLVDDAVPLPSFQHPARAFYIFGPEDGTLGARHLDWCPHRVMVPTRSCMNLAATVNVILYDRMAKADRQARGLRNADLGMTA
jgi:tRNA(Leu) C34 or U34 (ribose-2'-O)-methylase TrmL